MGATIDSTQGLRFPTGAAASAADDLVQRLDQLNIIGASLSAERDIDRLLEAILTAAKTITRADGGTLYRVSEDKTLRFEIVRTSSLKYYLGGTTGNPVPFYPIQLYRDGKPNHSMVAAYAALTGQTVNIADAYAAEGFDFSGTRAFDPAACGIPCLAGRNSGHQPHAHQPARATVRVVHQPYQYRDRRKIALHR